MKRFASVALLSCLMAVPVTLSAQELELTPNMSPVVQINPLGFLQFGPNLEVEFPVSPMLSIAPGFRIATLGLIPHLIAAADDESLGLSWTASLAAHLYPDGQGLQGFYVGPRFEAGRGSSSDDFADYDSTILVGVADFGYRWVYDSGFHLTFGAQTGGFLSSWEGSDGTSGDEGYIFFMLVLGVGMAL